MDASALQDNGKPAHGILVASVLSRKETNAEPPRSAAAVKTSPVRCKKQIQDQLGKQLRDFYQDVLTEPVPDRFIELLNKLELN
jgi:hypothetical protein